jgi:hypothetical protein
MSTHDAFDDRIRQRHAEALANLSPRVLAQLQQRRRAARHAPSPWRGLAWPLAAACAAGVLALGLQLRRPDIPSPVATPVVIDIDSDEPETAFAALDEAPDLYLWLASKDAATLAME